MNEYKLGQKYSQIYFINKISSLYPTLSFEFSEYVNWKTPVKIICKKCNEVFFRRPTYIKNKCYCPGCGKGAKSYSTLIDLKEDLRKKHDNFYDYSLLQETKLTLKQKIICPDHGIFSQEIAYHLRGSKCPKCCRSPNHIRKTNFTKALKVFNEIFKDEDDLPLYSFEKFNYIDNLTEGEVICPKHGSFNRSPAKLKKGHGCEICNNIPQKKKPKNTLTKEQFIERSSTKHNNKYIYEKFIYKNNVTKGIIICPVHGDFLQDPLNHLIGSGCPTCAIESRKLNEEELILEFKQLHGNKYSYPNLGYTSIFNTIEVFCNNCKTFFYPCASNFRQGAGCPHCRTNKKEEFIIELAKEYNIKYIYNDRDLIKPLEIDILIPNHKLAIEHNGLLWHSFGINDWSALNNYDKLNKNRHLTKTNMVEENGYQIFHIREDYIISNQKKDIWKSMILNKCGISYKKDARKLIVVDLSKYSKFVKQFLEDNHLQGSSPSKIKLGLQDPKTGVIYSIMTFGASRFNKNIEWELLRFCNAKFHNIRGAASKLLKAFERRFQPKSLISYANRDWSQGNLYHQLGFDFSHSSEPNYVYISNNREIISRHQVQKHKLQSWLESRNLVFDPNISERDNMINNGYRIYYDTGNLVYHKNYN